MVAWSLSRLFATRLLDDSTVFSDFRFPEECRGIFLDHGELERLIDAEGGGWSGVVEPPTQEPADVVPVRGRGGAQRGRKSAKRNQETLRDLFGDED